MLLLINILVTAVVNAGDDSGPVIRGKVTDISGNALAGAGVTVADSFIGIHTNSDGTYVITGLKNGDYKLSFSFIGYVTRVEDINLQGDIILNISLDREAIPD